jgi:hypothetical protein
MHESPQAFPFVQILQQGLPALVSPSATAHACTVPLSTFTSGGVERASASTGTNKAMHNQWRVVIDASPRTPNPWFQGSRYTTNRSSG